MDQAAFDRQAAAVLEDLFDKIDDQLGDQLDVDYEGGILTLKLQDGRTYLINKHAPNREIWLSSPVSGAWHFAWEAAGSRWRSTRTVSSGPDDLYSLLTAELTTVGGGTLDLQD
ncbi:MAG: iron donor protein CyaY [Dongiaceae bacterium]